MAPTALFIIVLGIVPAVATGVQAFYHVNPLTPPNRFVGLKNFRDLLADPTVQGSWTNTGFYVLIGVALSTILGIAMAVTLQRAFRFRTLVIALMILPWALPGVVEGVIWSWIYSPNSGVLNSTLHSLGIIHGDHLWIGQNHLLTVALIELVQVWQITPLSTLLILTSLQVIPDELYEAARLDGASRRQALASITLPLARPGIAVAMAMAIVATFNIFDQVFVLDDSSTGASVMTQTYNITFVSNDFGHGYALSLMVTLATVVVSFLALKAVYRKVSF